MKRDEVLDGRLLLEILPASMLCLETDSYACFKICLFSNFITKVNVPESLLM